MKIVHAQTEIAGQMGIICKELRKLGHYAAGYNCFHTYLNYKGDILNTDAFELLKNFEFLIENGDVFHFHNANTFLQDFSDLPFLKEKGKKMVMHHWGSDVRTVDLVNRLNPYPLPPTYYSDEEIHKQLTNLSEYIDTAIVQDYEAYQYVKDYYKIVYVIPLACNVEDFQVEYPSVENNVPLIIHAPTNREFKGSDYVEDAVNKLRDKGSTFTYQFLEKMSHDKALLEYLKSDIIVDQLLCGTYGMLSVEAMAMGKPVVAFIREDVRKRFPEDLPIIQATPENLDEVLEELINDPVRRHEIGKAGRKYVENYHSAERVTNELLRIYELL
ncbi:glycosyltransferase family 1 protein [Bacillus sp. HNG]|uniref:glycosyltransferase family protein n=1 Tax=Bacillus sp. HNG TaxID=2293325 RepID=UPI000E2F34CC|nr:glycosyltransferase [Bacillus sp. HNG]RFB18182.1 glycosyltransferase family 1 protein [Bacillus sp. HNG]